MGFIEDQNRKLAEEKQLAGKGMEYLDAKRAMDVARAQEAQRVLNTTPNSAGLANRYAQEIPYNDGMNEEAKYAEAAYRKMQEQAAQEKFLKDAAMRKGVSEQYVKDMNTKFSDPGYWEAAQRAANVENGMDLGLAAKFRQADTYGR